MQDPEVQLIRPPGCVGLGSSSRVKYRALRLIGGDRRLRWGSECFVHIYRPSFELFRYSGAPESAFRAEPPENEFTFAKNSLAEGPCGRLGHVAPLNVLDIAAAVANEVVMPRAFRVESRGAPLHRHF